MKLALVFMMVLPSLLCETVILNDLAPEEVQARLAVQSLDLQYAQFLGQRSLPADQAANLAEGRFAENPEDYLQNSYQANQFHGQDGLGRAMFGYSDWNQGRLEARNANGEVRGSYQYVDAFGDDVIVNYWADSLGFHQTDNRQAAAIEQVTDTPEVQAARLAHQRAWDAAAKAAQQSPDPMSDIYNANANRLDEEQSEYEQAQQILAQQQIPNQYQGVKTVIAPSDIDNVDPDSILVQTGAESRRSSQFKRVRDSNVAATETDFDGFNADNAERTGTPHGFFYSVDYPVQVVVEHPDVIARRLAPQSEASYLRRPTIVAPQQPLQQQLQQQQPQQPIVAEATNDDFQIVPIRILDTKKYKRNNDQQTSSRRRQATVRNRFQRQNPAPTVQTPLAPVVSKRRVNTTPTVAATMTTPFAAVSAAPSAPSSSEIIQIKSLTEQQREQELRRLVSNADAVDGVHDAQIHPKQATRARKYRSYF